MGSGGGMRFLWPLLALVPLTLVLGFTGTGGPTAIFICSALALIPLAGLLGKATESAAVYTGPNVGALLNATLGNAAELIITIIALRSGFIGVVKASIAGSIIGNILLVLGLSLLLGGIRNGTQRFDASTAGTNATMMALAVVALTIPAAMTLGTPSMQTSSIELLSDGLAIVLIVLYGLYLLYMFKQGGSNPAVAPGHETAEMKLPVAIALMAASTIGVVLMSESLVGVIEPVAATWGLSELFIGIILVPIVGNVAEHIVAVQVAVQNKMDLSLGIAVGSGLQIALFVAPVLVFVGWLMGTPMTLVFNRYEVAGLIGAAAIAVLISVDGKSNWLEGAQLIALYLMLAIAFFFIP